VAVDIKMQVDGQKYLSRKRPQDHE
jgi:hypothetical protein